MKKTTVILALMFGGLFSKPIMAQNPLHGAWSKCFKGEYFDHDYTIVLLPNGTEYEVESVFDKGSKCGQGTLLFSVTRKWSYEIKGNLFESKRINSQIMVWDSEIAEILNELSPCGITNYKSDQTFDCDFHSDEVSSQHVGLVTTTNFKSVNKDSMNFSKKDSELKLKSAPEIYGVWVKP